MIWLRSVIVLRSRLFRERLGGGWVKGEWKLIDYATAQIAGNGTCSQSERSTRPFSTRTASAEVTILAQHSPPGQL